MIKFQFLVENKTNHPECTAEHGLSIYLEAYGKKLLFDTGASSMFYRNAKAMGVEVKDVDFVAISHGHYDHGGGIPTFCRENEKASILVHEEAFGESFGTENGEIETENCGIPFKREKYASRCNFTKEPYWINDHIVVSGTIPEKYGNYSTEQFYKKVDGKLVEDHMNHEQFLAIEGEQGIFLFSGCSHKGVLPAIAYCKDLFPGKDIYMLVAGLHLYSATKEQCQSLINSLVDQNIDYVMPVHCTGIHSICEIKCILGEKCIVATAGDSYEY